MQNRKCNFIIFNFIILLRCSKVLFGLFWPYHTPLIWCEMWCNREYWSWRAERERCVGRGWGYYCRGPSTPPCTIQYSVLQGYLGGKTTPKQYRGNLCPKYCYCPKIVQHACLLPSSSKLTPIWVDGEIWIYGSIVLSLSSLWEIV